LLLDTHRGVLREAIADPQALLHADLLMRDEWLRRLLGHLALEGGGGRGGRTDPPAVGQGEVHPYFLGLCADVALAARRRGPASAALR